MREYDSKNIIRMIRMLELCFRRLFDLQSAVDLFPTVSRLHRIVDVGLYRQSDAAWQRRAACRRGRRTRRQFQTPEVQPPIYAGPSHPLALELCDMHEQLQQHAVITE